MDGSWKNVTIQLDNWLLGHVTVNDVTSYKDDVIKVKMATVNVTRDDNMAAGDAPGSYQHDLLTWNVWVAGDPFTFDLSFLGCLSDLAINGVYQQMAQQAVGLRG